MKIINLVDNAERVNFGIWNAAMATAPQLRARYGVESEMWHPPLQGDDMAACNGYERRILAPVSRSGFRATLRQAQLSPKETIIVTHGCWRFPTRWGGWFRRQGFRWVYVPHGMLEPWSRQQKALKKRIYFPLFERPCARQADVIRAVGGPEKANLDQLFNNHSHRVLIPNGVDRLPVSILKEKPSDQHPFLFLSRLHYKKGILPLLRGWLASALNNRPGYVLKIAGPDQGEGAALRELLTKTDNVQYLGAVYGAEKEALLRESHYFVLPSFSEGFPTSVLEAANYGLIPLISEGCNFPELLERNLALRLEPDPIQIRGALEGVLAMDAGALERLRKEVKAFVDSHYDLEIIAEMQYELYRGLL